MSNDTNMIIVESPTKAKTINGYLKSMPGQWIIRSSGGHILDLHKNKISLEFGENESDFKAKWFFISDAAEKNINEIKSLAKSCTAVFIATDDDREGERIADDIDRLLEHANTKRVVFREITKKSVIENLFASIRDIDENIVNAAKSARYIDREIGYLGSKILDKSVNHLSENKTEGNEKVGQGVGRVITPALKILCEQDKMIDIFVPQKYKILKIIYMYQGRSFEAHNDTRYDKDNTVIINKVVSNLYEHNHFVESYDKKIESVPPNPPLNTVQLQYSAWYIFKIMPEDTMRIAQKLFERGFITYHRTDSERLSKETFGPIQLIISDLFGKDYVIDYQRDFSKIAKKDKNKVQDAHEAIRPTNFTSTHFPKNLKKAGELTEEEHSIYLLIWARTIASQMADATYDRSTIQLKIIMDDKEPVNTNEVDGDDISEKNNDEVSNDMYFYARANNRLFDGWERVSDKIVVIKESKFGELKNKRNDDVYVPEIEINYQLHPLEVMIDEYTTKAPRRYGIGRFLETVYKFGFGRPSTLANLVSRLIDKDYVKVRKSDGVLIPTDNGKKVIKWVDDNFPWLSDIEHARRLEESLGKIEEGESELAVKTVYEYYEKIKSVAESLEINLIDYDKPSAQQVKLIQILAKKNGIVVGDDILNDLDKAKLFIKKYNSKNKFTECSICDNGQILDNEDYFKCNNKSCNFSISKSKIIDFFKRFGREMDDEEFNLSCKKIFSKRGLFCDDLKSKKNEIFTAKVKLKFDEKYKWGLELEFKK